MIRHPQRLRRDLTAEHPLPSLVGAPAAEHVVFEALERQEVVDGRVVERIDRKIGMRNTRRRHADRR